VNGVPLIVAAELPDDLQAWVDRMRRAHYPVERNRVAAHVTLFRSLPPSCEPELRARLAAAANAHSAIPARFASVMALERGTALRLASPSMLSVRRELAASLHGLLTPQDAAEPRLHVTVQNTVSPAAARALQRELAGALEPVQFRFAGLALHRWREGLWEFVGRWSFRG
jgi:hypothetical protein